MLSPATGTRLVASSGKGMRSGSLRVLSFPFLLARLPVVDRVLGHHRPTAYTRSGKCVPKRKIWPWYPKPMEPLPVDADDAPPTAPGTGMA